VKNPEITLVQCNFHGKSFYMNHDALGAPPPPLGIPGCDSTVLPVHTCADIFHAGNSEISQCAPAPDGGRAGARGLSSL
jgi:hypothetical protein